MTLNAWRPGCRFAVALCLLLPIRAPAQTGQLIEQSAAQLAQGDLPQAEATAWQVLNEGSNKPIAYALLGAIRLKQTRYAESARFLETAVRLNPGLMGARLNLANALMLQGKYTEAEIDLRQALMLDPNNMNARFAMARLKNARGQFRESLSFASGISSELRNSEDGLTLIASDALPLKDRELSASCIRDWLALPNRSRAGSVALAELYAAHHDSQNAISILEHTEQSDLQSFEIQFLLGELYFDRGDSAMAAAAYGRALDTRADCQRCLYSLGRISEQEGNPEQALSFLAQAKQLAPQDPDVLFAFGRVCLRKDLYDDAIDSLVHAIRLRPGNESFRYLLASAYTSKKEYPAAIALLEALSSAHASDPLFSYSLGAVEYLHSNFDRAVQHLGASIRLDSKQIGAYYYLALTLQRQGKTAEAEQAARALLARQPDHPPGLVALGEILSSQKRYAEAREVLEQAVALDGSSVKAHYQLGLVLTRLGQADAARAEFAAVNTLNAKADEQPELRIFRPRE
jgi:tetratricopeptide (TPR) repeat protein